MKTIAVTVANGWAVKEYLHSDFLAELTKHAQVVVLSPLGDDPGFRAQFESDRVAIEPLNLAPLGAVEREIERMFVFAQAYRHPSVMGANAMRFANRKHKRERMKLKSKLRLSILRPLTQLAARGVVRHLSIRQQMALEQAAFGALQREAQRLAAVFTARNVDFVFSTMPVIAYFDRPALWAAEHVGIPTGAIVPGWDNLFGKGRMPVPFSRYLVWSPWMGAILQSQYAKVRADQISIVGTIFLDFCLRAELRQSRAAFLRSVGGDPNRPLLLWACAPKNQTPNQPQMIEQLWEACRSGSIQGNPQLLVRPHPVGGGDYFADFRERHPDVLFTETNSDDPGSGLRWNPSLDDQKLLVNSVLHANVVLNFSSSITLEAFALDRPVVNVAYDAAPGSDYEWTTRTAYASESYRPVVELRATKIAHSPDDLIEHTNSYLRNPSQQHDERAALLRKICSTVDGKAAIRVAAEVLDAAGCSTRAADDGAVAADPMPSKTVSAS